MPFSQGMTVPLELSLRPAASGSGPYRLIFNPVEELAQLYTDEIGAADLDLAQANAILNGVEKEELLDVELDVEAAGASSLWIGSFPISWDPERGEISFSGQSAPLSPGIGRLALRVLVDRSLTEIFVGRGWAVFSAMTLFPAGKRLLKLEGAVRAVSLRIHPMKTSWS
jgi:sucrose-6-phosphate hydrolase SacC (GH32 family)